MASERVRFLTPDEVLAIHERLIEVFGGPPGVRDRGLPERALFRPQTGYYDDLAAMAAAPFESLLMNHAFLDGNKRVAVFATALGSTDGSRTQRPPSVSRRASREPHQ